MAERAFRLVARIGGREYRAAVQDAAVLGSSPDCDLVLPDPTVSRRHARVQAADGGLRVSDLGSRNGTRVDGERLQQDAVVAVGRVLQLGEVQVRIEPLAEEDVGAAVGADPGSPAAAPLAARPAPQPTLLSAGLTRFCVREMEALLLALAEGQGREQYAARVLAALAASEPAAGFRLLGDGEALLARSGRPGPPTFRLQRGALRLEVCCEPEAEATALRALGQLGLGLLAAAEAVRTAHAPAQPASGRTVRPEVSKGAACPNTAAGSSFDTSGRTEGGAAAPAAPATANPALREIYWQAARVARSRLNVLLTGESGTGKELLARYLHEASAEPPERYLVMNCAALPADLLDAELFGIEAGVATGVSARAGRFELAHGGTLFLDEIGDMSLDTQARILRVLQEREVYRVGSHRPRPADVRVVSATNRDLEAMVREGAFRLDLFHRIADWRAELPPLRARQEDIPNLAAQFLAEAMAARGARSGGLSQGAVDALLRYGWPGNVRELEREMARTALFLDDGEVLVSTMLKPDILAWCGAAADDTGMAAQLEREERRIIARALAACGGQVAAAAERLGISRSTLYRRLAQLGMDGPAR